jgi:hypothetical protein
LHRQVPIAIVDLHARLNRSILLAGGAYEGHFVEIPLRVDGLNRYRGRGAGV